MTVPLSVCSQDPLPSRIHCFSEQFLLFLFLFPVLSITHVSPGTNCVQSIPSVSVRRGDPERRSLPRRPPSLRASTHSFQPTGSLLGRAHQGSGLVSCPSRWVPRRVLFKPGSLSLPFLAGAKKMLAGAQTGLGRAGTALLCAGWSQSDQAALTDTTERG